MLVSKVSLSYTSLTSFLPRRLHQAPILPKIAAASAREVLGARASVPLPPCSPPWTRRWSKKLVGVGAAPLLEPQPRGAGFHSGLPVHGGGGPAALPARGSAAPGRGPAGRVGHGARAAPAGASAEAAAPPAGRGRAGGSSRTFPWVFPTGGCTHRRGVALRGAAVERTDLGVLRCAGCGLCRQGHPTGFSCERWA